jgi:hypothetical protein
VDCLSAGESSWIAERPAGIGAGSIPETLVILNTDARSVSWALDTDVPKTFAAAAMSERSERSERLVMTDRKLELQQLVVDLTDHEGVVDAFVAKSFTDRLVILDTRNGTVPEAVRERHGAHECYGSETVYGDDEDGPAFAGTVGDATRHHFVAVETRGAHQSSVVE